MLSNEKYYVTNHDYFNTGGGCMVSVFTVYDRKLNATRYVVANDEGFNMQTANTISCAEEFDHEELEKIIIESHDWSALCSEPAPWEMLFEDEEWKLYKYCQFEFYKKDCQRFKTKVELPVSWLSPDLYDSLTDDQRDWLRENELNVETDGNYVWMPKAYDDYLEERCQKKLQEIKDFKQWFDNLIGAENTEEDIMKVYREEITLSFNGKSIKLEFDANTYSNISDLLENIIDNF